MNHSFDKDPTDHNTTTSTNTTTTTNNDNTYASEEDALKCALQYSIGKFCEDQRNPKMQTKITPDAVHALTELAWHYTTSSLANDLAMFCVHRKSKTINVEDVKLAGRKLPDQLKGELEAFCREQLDVSAATSNFVLQNGSVNRRTENSDKTIGKKQRKDSTEDSKSIDFEQLDAKQRRDYYLKKAAESSSSEDDNSNTSSDILDVTNSVNRKAQPIQLEILSSSSSDDNSGKNDSSEDEHEFVD